MKSIKDFSNDSISQLRTIHGGDYEVNTSCTQGRIFGCNIARFNGCDELISMRSIGKSPNAKNI